MLELLADRGLLGRWVAVDATTLKANAAVPSIVRRDSGQKYETFKAMEGTHSHSVRRSLQPTLLPSRIDIEFPRVAPRPIDVARSSGPPRRLEDGKAGCDESGRSSPPRRNRDKKDDAL